MFMGSLSFAIFITTMVPTLTLLEFYLYYGAAIFVLGISIAHMMGKIQKIIFTKEHFILKDVGKRGIHFKWKNIACITSQRKLFQLVPVMVIYEEKNQFIRKITVIGYYREDFIESLIRFATNAKVSPSVTQYLVKIKSE